MTSVSKHLAEYVELNVTDVRDGTVMYMSFIYTTSQTSILMGFVIIVRNRKIRL